MVWDVSCRGWKTSHVYVPFYQADCWGVESQAKPSSNMTDAPDISTEETLQQNPCERETMQKSTGKRLKILSILRPVQCWSTQTHRSESLTKAFKGRLPQKSCVRATAASSGRAPTWAGPRTHGGSFGQRTSAQRGRSLGTMSHEGTESVWDKDQCCWLTKPQVKTYQNDQAGQLASNSQV